MVAETPRAIGRPATTRRISRIVRRTPHGRVRSLAQLARNKVGGRRSRKVSRRQARDRPYQSSAIRFRSPSFTLRSHGSSQRRPGSRHLELEFKQRPLRRSEVPPLGPALRRTTQVSRCCQRTRRRGLNRRVGVHLELRPKMHGNRPESCVPINEGGLTGLEPRATSSCALNHPGIAGGFDVS